MIYCVSLCLIVRREVGVWIAKGNLPIVFGGKQHGVRFVALDGGIKHTDERPVQGERFDGSPDNYDAGLITHFLKRLDGLTVIRHWLCPPK